MFLTLLFIVIAAHQTVASEIEPSTFDCPNVSTNKDDVEFYERKGDQLVKLVLGKNEADFNRDTKWFVLVDGFMCSRQTPLATNLTRDLKEANPDAKIIYVDYHKLSGADSNINLTNMLQVTTCYTKVVLNVQKVGEKIAETLKLLGVDYKNIQLVGHSLGAHICEAAGITYNRLTGRSVARCTGLDPAGPLFTPAFYPLKGLGKDCGSYVDVYCTNMGGLGSTDGHRGHGNVIINGGHVQPNCPPPTPGDFFSGYLSHIYSWQWFGKTALGTDNSKAGECDFKNTTSKQYCYSTTPSKNFHPNTIVGAKMHEEVYGTYALYGTI